MCFTSSSSQQNTSSHFHSSQKTADWRYQKQKIQAQEETGNNPNYESAPPFNFPKCNSASHIPTASTKQALETPSPQKTNKHKTSSNWVQNHTDKKRRNTEKIKRNRHLLLQLSISATFFAITNPQRSSSKQSAKRTRLRKRRKRANEERGRRTGGGQAQALVDSKGLLRRSPRGDGTQARGFFH